MRKISLDAAQTFVSAVTPKYIVTGSEKLEVLGADEFLKWFKSSAMPKSYRKVLWDIVGEAVKKKVVRAILARRLKPKKGDSIQDVAVLVAVPGHNLGEVGIGQAVVEASSDGDDEDSDNAEFKSCPKYTKCIDYGWFGMQCDPQVWVVRADETCPDPECTGKDDCDSQGSDGYSDIAEALAS